MSKSAHDDVLDASLNEIKDNCTLQVLCSQEPTTRAEAVTTYALADVAIGSGDLTIGDGDVSGRKAAVAAKSTVTIDASGTGTHIAIVDGTRLLWVTTCTSVVVVATETIDFPTWDIEMRDPA